IGNEDRREASASGVRAPSLTPLHATFDRSHDACILSSQRLPVLDDARGPGPADPPSIRAQAAGR
ncbi:MAG: hypothetical protein PVI28_15830, partial [Gammaproteobacteria bacterium]